MSLRTVLRVLVLFDFFEVCLVWQIGGRPGILCLALQLECLAGMFSWFRKWEAYRIAQKQAHEESCVHVLWFPMNKMGNIRVFFFTIQRLMCNIEAAEDAGGGTSGPLGRRGNLFRTEAGAW